MLVVKLIVLFALVCLVARGYTIKDAKKVNKAERQIEQVQRSAQEMYELVENEKKVLLETIDELRLEVADLRADRAKLLGELLKTR